MGAFEYTAVDPKGRQHKGLLEGDTARSVRQMLREQNLLPLTVAEVAQREAKRQKSGLRRGIGAMDLALITRQLATLVHSGLPLEEALLAVGQQTEKARIRSILYGVRARVMEGHQLVDGLNDFPHAFPELYRATVAAGEQSGYLDAVLERLADYTESRHGLKQTVTNALIYPAVLTVVALGIVVVLLTWVVPKVVGVYDDLAQELPFLTRALMSVSDFLRDYWWLLALAVVAVVYMIRALLKQPGPRRSFDGMLLKVPVVGRLVRGLNTARFARTLQILAGSGVPVLEAFRIAAAVVSNVPMREAVESAARSIREGAPIGRSLAASKLFPPITIHLINSGEASGKLETMLDRAAMYQERELETTIQTLLALLQPLLILAMAVIVVVIILATLQPIINFNDMIR